MRKRILAAVCVMTLAMSLVACGKKPAGNADTTTPAATEAPTAEGPTEEPTLPGIEDAEGFKDLYADYFKIGTCINPAMLKNLNYRQFIIKNYNSVTCENNMKPESIIDRVATVTTSDLSDGGTHMVLSFKNLATELDFARDNGIQMRGHTFIWHEQTPEWIFHVNFNPDKEFASREVMLKRVDNYFKDTFEWVEANYPNLFYAWDIANECMGDNNSMRDSLWYQTIGEDYLEQIFAIARKYAPSYIKLFYNDYNESVSAKRGAIIRMLKPIADAGNLDGMGMQCHLSGANTVMDVLNSVRKYSEDLGVEVHITELDVKQSSTATDPEAVQANYYKALFNGLKNLKADGVNITNVTFWGFVDNLSWLKEDKPLLLNRDMSPKAAYYAVLEAGMAE